MVKSSAKRRRQGTLTRVPVAVSVRQGREAARLDTVGSNLEGSGSAAGQPSLSPDLIEVYRRLLDRPPGPYGALADSLRSAGSLVRQNQEPEAATGRLALAGACRDVIEAWLPRLVADAREQGASWSEIGEALGVTKQSAWVRFEQLV